MKIYIAADHRGHTYKVELIQKLREKHIDIVDVWDHPLDPIDDDPDAAHAVVAVMKKDPLDSIGVVICGSGVGVSITANRYTGIYCVLGHTLKQVEHGRVWDHANILALGSDFTPIDDALAFIMAMIQSKPGSEERMVRRVEKMDSVATQYTI
ncbi:MAG: RpiB/LacA/LacB family sugar-phosphate isomerase [Candidatus Roizmanbacteria bacterium]